MKTLYLDFRGPAVTICNEAYTQILSIIEKGRVCGRYATPYTDDRPSGKTCYNQEPRYPIQIENLEEG